MNDEFEKPCQHCTSFCPTWYTGAMREPSTCPTCGRFAYMIFESDYDRGFKAGQQSVLAKFPSDREIGEYYDKNSSELYTLMKWLKSKLKVSYDK